jgi:hypothetical protein
VTIEIKYTSNYRTNSTVDYHFRTVKTEKLALFSSVDRKRYLMSRIAGPKIKPLVSKQEVPESFTGYGWEAGWAGGLAKNQVTRHDNPGSRLWQSVNKNS